MKWQPHFCEEETITHGDGSKDYFRQHWVFGILVWTSFKTTYPPKLSISESLPATGDAEWEDLDWDELPVWTELTSIKEMEALFNRASEECLEALRELEMENRHGAEYKWPADHHFGKLERAVDGLMSELEQLPPLTWMRWLVNWLSRKL
jgi:hypothetical protein